jgi:hypothetical protein
MNKKMTYEKKKRKKEKKIQAIVGQKNTNGKKEVYRAVRISQSLKKMN